MKIKREIITEISEIENNSVEKFTNPNMFCKPDTVDLQQD